MQKLIQLDYFHFLSRQQKNLYIEKCQHLVVIIESTERILKVSASSKNNTFEIITSTKDKQINKYVLRELEHENL